MLLDEANARRARFAGPMGSFCRVVCSRPVIFCPASTATRLEKPDRPALASLARTLLKRSLTDDSDPRRSAIENPSP
jgi:hypothetical protein